MGRHGLDAERVPRPDEGRWIRRAGLSWFIRCLAVAVPMAGALAAGIGVSRLLPPPHGWLGEVGWYTAVLLTSLVTLLIVDRVARRLLPLAMLLRLSLVFPDRAPSRMAIALRATNARRLEGCMDEAMRGTGDPAPVLTLAAALNAHDRRTRGHSDRVRALTDLVAEELRLSDTEAERLRWAAFLHDIGKLAVPTKVLNKHGTLTPSEWSTVHRHPERGERLAEPLASWLGEWIHGIGEHHEHYDGTGYPRGLRGDEITLAGRIVAVTDAFETMTALRTYNRPMTPGRAREELTRCAGKHFDPRVVRSFLSISIGRLRWTVGAAAWLAQLPFVGVPARAGAQLVTSAAGAELTVVPVVGALAVSLAGVATPLSLEVRASVPGPGAGITAPGPGELTAGWHPMVDIGGGLGVVPDGTSSILIGLGVGSDPGKSGSHPAPPVQANGTPHEETSGQSEGGGDGTSQAGGPGGGSGPGGGAGQGAGLLNPGLLDPPVEIPGLVDNPGLTGNPGLHT